MAELKRWPLGLNQPGYTYPAEYLRAQIYAAAAGGNGVDSPTAMKVTAQPAPDNTVNILPGSATVKSTYAGAEGQAYHLWNFGPYTLEIPPTGSSPGGRHDLIVVRPYDPQYADFPPGAPQRELTAEEAAEYDFWDFVIIQGRSANTTLGFPHAKLGHIRRGPNRTTVEPDDIIDLRELANAKSHRFVDARNLDQSEEQRVTSGTTVFPDAATQYLHIPDFATRVQVMASWGTIRVPASQSRTSGYCSVELTHPDGSVLSTQISRFSFPYNTAHEDRPSIVFGHQLALPEKWRGQDARIRMMATKQTGVDAYMDGASSYTLDLHFEQGVL